jgi:ABC-type bacteriocin/lantibiotic exporter with double-glycine peptidase domain
VHKERISEILKIKKFNNFINSFSRGINTLVGENGSKLSGGQIQIIGIARALYFNRNILICDEITNSLDKKSEKAVMKYIENLDKTIIIISHKLENLQFCDRIYTIKNSRLSLHKAR